MATEVKITIIGLDAGLSFSKTTDRARALKGADFVINTAQVGGHDWVEEQRSLAEKCGYYRGIRLHNFGQAAFFLEVARDIERLANSVCQSCLWLKLCTNCLLACVLSWSKTAVGMSLTIACLEPTNFAKAFSNLPVIPARCQPKRPEFKTSLR